MKKREWKDRARLAEADAASERTNRVAMQDYLFRLRAAIEPHVKDVGITYGGWVDHAIRLIGEREASK